jgi:hypothetical protein
MERKRCQHEPRKKAGRQQGAPMVAQVDRGFLTDGRGMGELIRCMDWFQDTDRSRPEP